MCVVALPVYARLVSAFVLVVLACRTRESWRARALIRIADGSAFGAVPARLGGAVVFLLAVVA